MPVGWIDREGDRLSHSRALRLDGVPAEGYAWARFTAAGRLLHAAFACNSATQF
jgi:hypothetical protein